VVEFNEGVIWGWPWREVRWGQHVCCPNQTHWCCRLHQEFCHCFECSSGSYRPASPSL